MGEAVSGAHHMSELMSIAGPLGVGAILAWYMWYTVTVILPMKDKVHSELLEKQVAKHEEVVNRIVMEFRNEAKEARVSESERLKISSELARSGHAGISNLVTAINELKAEFSRHAGAS